MHEQPTRPNPGTQEGGGPDPVPEADEPLSTVRLAYFHRAADFCCARSQRISHFLIREAPEWIAVGYTWVFVLPNPDDPGEVWGYYSLSPAELARSGISGSQQKRIPKGIPVSLQRIGFMGRHDGAPRGIGAGLVYDAALRVFREGTGWRLTLDVEGGFTNTSLTSWYEGVGFTKAKTLPGKMYGPLQ